MDARSASKPSFLIAALIVVASVASTETLKASDDEFLDAYFICLSQMGSICRLDRQTLQMEFFVGPVGFPFYGQWHTDGFLYMPDRILDVIMKIDCDGNVEALSLGGLVKEPITTIVGPDGKLYVSSSLENKIIRVDKDTGAQEIFADAGSGLIDGPGGLAFDRDGVLYVGNIFANTVVTIDQSGNVSPFFDGQGLLDEPAGMQIDGSGNLFMTNWKTKDVVRVRLDTGRADVFATHPDFLEPNDLKLSRRGELLTTVSDTAALFRVRATGAVELIAQDLSLGDWVGVSVPEDAEPSPASMTPYGAGTAGSGGIVPEFHGIFTPRLGAEAALEVRDVLGGASGVLLWSTVQGNNPGFGGQVLVELVPPFGILPLAVPGAGPGGGSLRLPFTIPNDPAFDGLVLYEQVLFLDDAAPKGVSMSNGLEISIGS